MDTFAASGLSLTISGSGAGTAPADAPTTQRTADGKVRFENDNYRITAGDDNQVLIQNKNTGEQYRIWGDPHVEIDGKHAFDFWGQTTFVLEDGTKVTIETTPWDEGGNGATIASEVTITDGEYTTVINGVDTNTRGDLGFKEYHGTVATLKELAERDGNVVHENAEGSGFIAVDPDGSTRGVDQAFINATDEIKQGGPSFVQARAEAFHVFSSLMSIIFSGSFVEAQPADTTPDPEAQPTPEAEPWNWSFTLTLSRYSWG